MALEHAQPGQVITLASPATGTAPHPSHALIKTHALELIHLVLPKGRQVPSHELPGEITLLCLEGRLRVVHAGQRSELGPLQLLLLSGGVPHAVEALEDSAALLTIQHPPGKPGSGSSTVGATAPAITTEVKEL